MSQIGQYAQGNLGIGINSFQLNNIGGNTIVNPVPGSKNFRLLWINITNLLATINYFQIFKVSPLVSTVTIPDFSYGVPPNESIFLNFGKDGAVKGDANTPQPLLFGFSSTPIVFTAHAGQSAQATYLLLDGT